VAGAPTAMLKCVVSIGSVFDSILELQQERWPTSWGSGLSHRVCAVHVCDVWKLCKGMSSAVVEGDRVQRMWMGEKMNWL